MRSCRLLLIALLAAVMPLSVARACSCAWGTYRDAHRRSDAVFLGRPIAFRPSLLEPFSAEVTRFRVERVWKGEVGTEVMVVGWFNHGCGIQFPDEGQRIFVFARRDEWGRLTTSGCSGTTWEAPPYVYSDVEGKPDTIDLTGDLLEQLGPGVPAVGPPQPDPWPALAAWGVIVIAVMSTWGIASRVRQRSAS